MVRFRFVKGPRPGQYTKHSAGKVRAAADRASQLSKWSRR
jgi:hypothetical protein